MSYVPGLTAADPLAGFGAAYLAWAGELWQWYARAAAAADAVGGAGRSPAFPADEIHDFARRFFVAAAPPFLNPSATGWPPPPSALPPALGWLREHQERYHVWQRAAERAAGAHALWLAALAPAAADAAQVLAGSLAQGAVPAGPRALFDRWIEAAEAAWSRVAHAEHYVRAQTALFDAALELHHAQQAIADEAARLAGVPTRAEVDELQRRLRALEGDGRPP